MTYEAPQAALWAIPAWLFLAAFLCIAAAVVESVIWPAVRRYMLLVSYHLTKGTE